MLPDMMKGVFVFVHVLNNLAKHDFLEMKVDYIALSIPVFFLLIGIELIIQFASKKTYTTSVIPSLYQIVSVIYSFASLAWFSKIHKSMS